MTLAYVIELDVFNAIVHVVSRASSTYMASAILTKIHWPADSDLIHDNSM